MTRPITALVLDIAIEGGLLLKPGLSHRCRPALDCEATLGSNVYDVRFGGACAAKEFALQCSLLRGFQAAKLLCSPVTLLIDCLGQLSNSKITGATGPGPVCCIIR